MAECREETGGSGYVDFLSFTPPPFVWQNHKLGPSGLRQMIFAIRYARKTVKICQTSAAAGFFLLHSTLLSCRVFFRYFFHNNRSLNLTHKNRAAKLFSHTARRVSDYCLTGIFLTEILNLLSGIIPFSDKLVGSLVIFVIDRFQFLNQFFSLKSSAGAQGFQRIVIISQLCIHVNSAESQDPWVSYVIHPLQNLFRTVP